MNTSLTRYCVTSWALMTTSASVLGQGAPQIPQRPHLDDPHYYDRDAAHDAPYAAKARAEAKEKADRMMRAASAKPTPHTVDGSPDLNGIWIIPGEGLAVIISPDGKDRKSCLVHFLMGSQAPVVPPMPPNQPSYKPEFQAKVQQLWIDQTHQGPTAYTCGEPGVPRMGPPNEIVQIPGQVVLLYQQGRAGGIPANTFRVVPSDGRHQSISQRS